MPPIHSTSFVPLFSHDVTMAMRSPPGTEERKEPFRHLSNLLHRQIGQRKKTLLMRHEIAYLVNNRDRAVGREKMVDLTHAELAYQCWRMNLCSEHGLGFDGYPADLLISAQTAYRYLPRIFLKIETTYAEPRHPGGQQRLIDATMMTSAIVGEEREQ